jgi:hypothetical protein
MVLIYSIGLFVLGVIISTIISEIVRKIINKNKK